MNVSSTVDVFDFYPTITMLDDCCWRGKRTPKFRARLDFIELASNRSVVRCAEKEKQKKSKEEIRRHTHILVRVEVSRGKGGDEYPPLTSTSDDRLQYRQYIQHGYWTVLDQREISSIANRQRVSDTGDWQRVLRLPVVPVCTIPDTTNNQTFSSHHHLMFNGKLIFILH